MYPTESAILASIIGSVGVLATVVIFSYGYNRNAKYERRLAAARRASIAEIASEEVINNED